MKYSILVATLTGLLAVGPAASSEITPAASLSVQRRADAIGAPIRSKEQLHAYLSITPDSPLHKLGRAKMQSFLDSLTFTKAGLGSYSYIELEGMSSTNIYRVLSLFGAQTDRVRGRRAQAGGCAAWRRWSIIDQFRAALTSARAVVPPPRLRASPPGFDAVDALRRQQVWRGLVRPARGRSRDAV